MKLSRYGLPVVAALIACCFATVSWAALAVPGNFQDEAGFGGDWTPASAPTMNDLTGGLWDLSLGTLASSTKYEFKILDDEGTPPAAWGDPEITPNNVWMLSSSDPNNTATATINLDRNDNSSDGFSPSTDRVTISTDTDPNIFSGYFATGNWESELGGSDFTGNDPNFALSNAGGNLWTIDFSVPVTGNYEIKATGDCGLSAFDCQWGSDGRYTDSANLPFTVVDPNQVFTFSLDLDKGAIKIEDASGFIPGDTNNDSVVDLVNDFAPIRDNWFNQTFLRTDGNLDNTGDSNGIVDLTDFRQWKEAYAATLPLSGGLIGAAQAVPEPSTIAMALLFGFGVFGRARKRVC